MKINVRKKPNGTYSPESAGYLSCDLQSSLPVTESRPIQKIPRVLGRFLTVLGSALVLLLALLILIVTPILAFLIGVDLFYYAGEGPSRWPVSQGIITFSNIYETEKEGSFRRVWFDYAVDEVQYTSFQGFKSGPDEELKYTPGNKIQVYHNPVDSETAVINPDCSVWSFAGDEIEPDIIFLVLMVPSWIGAIVLLKWANAKLKKK